MTMKSAKAVIMSKLMRRSVCLAAAALLADGCGAFAPMPGTSLSGRHSLALRMSSDQVAISEIACRLNAHTQRGPAMHN